MAHATRRRPPGGARRATPVPPAPPPPRGKAATLAALLGAAALVTVFAIILGNVARGGSQSTVTDATSAAPTFPVDGRTEGSATAPVTMIEYADFQCPNCGGFARGTEKQLESKYVATGQLRIEFRDYAFLGPESVQAAQAAQCAGEQGKYFPYRNTLFASQGRENSGAFSNSKLKGFAIQLGLNAPTFNACLDSGRYADRVKSDFQAAQLAGVSGTPTFFINGRMIVGNQPLAVFDQAIQQALAAAGGGSR